MKLLSQLKKDLEFNRNLSTLIDVLKEIAISQYHLLERRIRTFDKTFRILEGLFALLPQGASHSQLLKWEERKPGVIAITSDAGLLGALNMQVMSLALHEVQTKQAKLIIIGEKGKTYAQESDISFVAFEGIKDERRLAQAYQLRDYISGEVMGLRIGTLKIIYPYATSIVAQHVQSLQLLPFASTKKANMPPASELIMESSIDAIVGYLIYLLLGHKFYEIFGLSRLAEVAARFVHLEDSKHKLEDIEKQLKLQYFRQRHELIDRNMREIYSARLAFT